MSDAQARLQRLLGGPALRDLRQRLRRHYEREDGPARRTLQLGQLNAAEHEALALLTGRPPRAARSIRIDIAQVDAALRAAGVCDSLREALEQLDGPILDRAAAQRTAREAWSALRRAPDHTPCLQAWLNTQAAAALLRRLARQDAGAAADLLARADAVLRQLPAAGITRAQLAAQTLGNAHALDTGQPVASIVLAIWRSIQTDTASPPVAAAGLETPGQPDADGPAQEASVATERIRDVWARAGVLVNELARPALALNLPVAGPALAVGSAGEPAYLSLRQLLRTPPAWSVGGLPVFVCENPNLLAIAADRLGAACAPLVCTDGMPAAAQRTLLGQLAQAGADLRYHGDFDWPGLRIANRVMRSWQARPWRMAAQDYEAAVQSAPQRRRDLAETGVDADWDPLLAAAMQRHGLAIAEEAVADTLLTDLHFHLPDQR